MVKQSIWIAISIGVFFAGLGIGYGIFVNSQMNTFGHMGPGSFGMMSEPQMQQIMEDPDMLNQWHQTMMNNPEVRNQWMNTLLQDPQAMEQFHKMMIDDPNHMSMMMSTPDMQRWMFSQEHSRQMTQIMRENHNFTQGFMMELINDPNLRLHMLGHMSENPDAMEQMRHMVNDTSHMDGHMDQNMSP